VSVNESGDERWYALRDEVRALRARLEAIEAELNQRLAPPPSTAAPASEPAPPVQPASPYPQTPAAAAQPARAVIETRLGLTLLNRIGVVTLILGAGFFFKYAVDNQWIGPWARVLLGVLAGAASLAAAGRLFHRGQRAFAQGITGLGIALLFVSFYAGFGFYHLYPAVPAFLLMLVPAALSLRYDSLPVVLLGLFGGYITPVLIGANPWVLFAFLLLLNGTAAWVSRRRGWTAVEGLALAATTYHFAGTAEDSHRGLATLFLAAYYAVFTLSRSLPIRHAVQILASLGVVLVWHKSEPEFLLLSLAFAGAGLRVAPSGLIGFWLAWTFWQTGARSAGPAFLTATLVFAAYYALPFFRSVPRFVGPLNGVAYYLGCFAVLDGRHHAWMGLLALAVAAAYVVVARRGELPELNFGLAAAFVAIAIAAQFTGFLITAGWAVEAAAMAYIGQPVTALIGLALILIRLTAFDAPEPVSSTLFNARFVAFLASALSYWLTARHLKRLRVAAGVYSMGHVILLWGGVLEIGSWAARYAPSVQTSILTAGFSILGAAYAVALIASGVLWNFPLNRALGLALIGLVVLKLYLYDVWLLARLYRTTAFMALGALLVLGSYLYSRYRERIESWWRESSPLSK
jgi:uncharacterized membrane protein